MEGKVFGDEVKAQKGQGVGQMDCKGHRSRMVVAAAWGEDCEPIAKVFSM